MPSRTPVYTYTVHRGAGRGGGVRGTVARHTFLPDAGPRDPGQRFLAARPPPGAVVWPIAYNYSSRVAKTELAS